MFLPVIWLCSSQNWWHLEISVLDRMPKTYILCGPLKEFSRVSLTISHYVDNSAYQRHWRHNCRAVYGTPFRWACRGSVQELLPVCWVPTGRLSCMRHCVRIKDQDMASAWRSSEPEEEAASAIMEHCTQRWRSALAVLGELPGQNDYLCSGDLETLHKYVNSL